MDVREKLDWVLETYGSSMTRHEYEYVVANRDRADDDDVAQVLSRIGALRGRADNPMPVLYDLFMRHHSGDKKAGPAFMVMLGTIDLMCLEDRAIVGMWRSSISAGHYLDYVKGDTRCTRPTYTATETTTTSSS